MLMRLVLLGAPGSGKGTQAARLKDHLQVPHISTGDLLRAEVKAGSKLGLEAKEIMARGELVSDAILLGMLEDRFSRPDTANGFILDGYPRNLAQADALDTLLKRIGQPMEAAVQMEVPTELLVERIAGRAAAEGRADDTPESVRTRLNVYNEQTAPVIEFFRQHGQLTVVDGVGSMDEVFTRIIEAIEPVRAVG
jgi:adenylate kinase